jgi:hypothetical protein
MPVAVVLERQALRLCRCERMFEAQPIKRSCLQFVVCICYLSWKLDSLILLQSSALPSPSRDSVMSRASTQANGSSSTQPPASHPTLAWATPEKPRREGKSILELNRCFLNLNIMMAK